MPTSAPAGDVLKRGFDVVVAGVACLVMLPVLLIAATAVRLGDGGPVFYKGRRVGRHGRTFEMLKFRTMCVDADRRGGTSTAADDARVTGVGRVLRRGKLDELPQLLNVLRGDMSLVGPRPQVEWAVARYSAEERGVLAVRPGITDPASLRFANEADILNGSSDPDQAYMELIHPEKMRLSLDYVRRRTFLRDLMVLGQTAAAVLGLARYTVDPGVLRGQRS